MAEAYIRSSFSDYSTIRMYRVKLVYMLLRGGLPGGMKAWEAREEGDSSANDCGRDCLIAAMPAVLG